MRKITFPQKKNMANEPAERRRSAGEAAENSAARRMLYAEKFSTFESVNVRCKKVVLGSSQLQGRNC